MHEGRSSAPVLGPSVERSAAYQLLLVWNGPETHRVDHRIPGKGV